MTRDGGRRPATRTGVWLFATLLAGASVGWAGTAALAHEPGRAARVAALPQGLQTVLGGSVERTRTGLYRVELPSGRSVLTHGPDPKRQMNNRDLDGALQSAGEERDPVCATDHYQHVLYGRLAGTSDLSSVHAPVIRRAVRRMNALLNEDALASGGVTADYKVLCDPAGEIRVDSFTSPTIELDDIIYAAKQAGFRDSGADYTIFFDATSDYCGIATYYPDTRLAENNRSNLGGGYAVSYQGCWLDETPMHESGHNQGAVQGGSPNSTGSGGHCNDESDVMCYSPDGGDENQSGTVLRCAGRTYYDCGYDDYFDATPEPGEYLASHWNLGSPLNRFIAFREPPPPPGGSPEPPSSPPTEPAGSEEPDQPCSARHCAILLRDGSPRQATAPRKGAWTYYRVALPPNQTRLEVLVDGPRCGRARCAPDLDLYLRRRRIPREERWDCSSRRRGSDEACRIRRPPAGTWFVGVRSVRARAGATFSVIASLESDERTLGSAATPPTGAVR